MLDNKTIVANNFYKPSELLGIFKNFLSNKEINTNVVCLQGIYWKSDKIYGGTAYDKLKDESSSEELTIIVPITLRDDLKNGNLVTVYGILDRNITNYGAIQILVKISRVEKVKEIVISEDEVKRAELRRKKEELGYKNVDGILENKLFDGKKPQVALIYAGTSITNADFEKGLVAAKSNIDFKEHRVSFSDSVSLCALIHSLDNGCFDIIAIVRGGGSGIEKLDDPSVVEVLSNLKTAWIYGVGHEKENLFIRNIADKVIPIPFALGTYFRDSVESVIQKKNNSRAVLVQEVKKQYEKQIEDSNKKNQELTKQLQTLTKAQEDNQKLNKEQIEAAQKSNKDLQERLDKQGKTLIDMQGQQQKQQDDFSKSLNKMQEANKELQSNLTKLTSQNGQYTRELEEAKRKLSEAQKHKPNVIGYIVAIIVLTIALIIALIK